MSVPQLLANGQIGGRGGIASKKKCHVSAFIGGQGGIASFLELGAEGVFGSKGGLVSTTRAKPHATLGGKGGILSTLTADTHGTIGGKGGLSSVTRMGVTYPCCPGLYIATTLNVTVGGVASGTAVWNAGIVGWEWYNLNVSHTNYLQCITVGSSHTWEIRPVNAHCTATYSTTSVSCSHPFSLTMSVTFLGALCPEIGGPVKVVFSE